MFRAISPSTAWDLSAGVSKVIGTTIHPPLMEYYLDTDRHQQAWHTLRRSYQGEPGLWFLMAESIGWGVWQAVLASAVSSDAPVPVGPHVRLVLGDGLVRAIQVDLAEQHLGHERRAPRLKRTVHLAIDFMQDHLEDQIGVADVARAVSLSPHYFTAISTEQTGLTPNQFLTNLRIERAREYLAQHRMAPSDVWLAFGYSPSYFWRHFKRKTGLTPAHFARQARAQGARR